MNPFHDRMVAIVTGQAAVLYSRLHLVVLDVSKVRRVLWMIIVNVCILDVLMIVFSFCLMNDDVHFAHPAAVYNRIQLTGFYVQFFVICGICIYEAICALM